MMWYYIAFDDDTGCEIEAKDRSINALNGNLFDLIERLTNPDVTPEEVELLTKVSDSVAGLAK